MTISAAKQKHFDKVYKNAPMIECYCGCGKITKSKDKYGRNKMFINGHNGRKYADPTQYKREWNHRNLDARYVYKIEYYGKRKIELILYKGSKCERCGLEYDGKNAGIFQFHHIDPSTKEFQIGRNLANYSRVVVMKEVDKCEILCGNCHLAEHCREF